MGRTALTFFRGEPVAGVQVYLLAQGLVDRVHLVFIGKPYVGGFCHGRRPDQQGKRTVVLKGQDHLTAEAGIPKSMATDTFLSC